MIYLIVIGWLLLGALGGFLTLRDEWSKWGVIVVADLLVALVLFITGPIGLLLGALFAGVDIVVFRRRW